MSARAEPLTIRQAAIDELIPDAMNPRRMSETQARKLMGSLEAFGAVEPAVFNTQTSELVGGHMRVNAARVLGWATYPTVDVDLTRTEQRQLNLALNRIAGEWDEDKLAEVLWDLKESGADMALTGFEEGELEKLLRSVGPDDDEGGRRLEATGWQVTIDCRSEEHQAELLARFDAEGLVAHPVML